MALAAASFFTACAQPQSDAQNVAALPAAVWTQTACETIALPSTDAQETLTCLHASGSFCAFFSNGRPYYCQTADGKISHRLNKWGSSLTITQADDDDRPQTENYYANGKLARVTAYDYINHVKSVLYLDEAQTRLYQYSMPNGRVLDKYYFRPGQPYVHYPDGNDMGEINGPWEEKDGQIFLDGKPFWPLPQNTAVPDTCETFKGACDHDR